MRSSLSSSRRGQNSVRPAMRATLVSATAALALGALFPVSAHALSKHATENVMLVFDASASMRSPMGDESRMDVARRVVKDAIVQWRRRGLSTGLVAYGHRDRNSCSDIETLVPVGQASPREFTRIVDTIRPRGRTPLGEALQRAAEGLRFRQEKATVVLISDGRENCQADPCAVARSLKRSGVKFIAHVVGFGVSRKDEGDLKCIAMETGGQYVSARNADSLVGALTRVARAVKPVSADVEDVAEPAPIGTAELFLPELKEGTYRLVIRKTRSVGGFAATSDLEPRWKDRSPAVSVRVPAASVRVEDKKIAEPIVSVRMSRDGKQEPVISIRFPRDSSEKKPAVSVRVADVGPVEPGSPAISVRVPNKPRRVSSTAKRKFARVATIDAPSRVVARKSFVAGWSGPNVNGDRVELLAEGETACNAAIQSISVHHYDVNQDGRFTFVAPMRVGDYELAYCSAKSGRALARQPISVVARDGDIVAPREEIATADAGSVWRDEAKPTVRYRRSVQLNSDTETRAVKRPKRRSIFADDTDEAEDREDDGFFVDEMEDDADDQDTLADTRPSRPSFAPKQDKEDERSARRRSFDDGDDEVVSDTSEIVDIAPRARPRFKSEPRPKRRVTRREAPKFSDEDLAPLDLRPTRRARTKRPARTNSQARRPAFKPRRPAFDDFSDDADVTLEPRRRTANRPTFSDERTTRRTRKPRRREDATVTVAPKRTARLPRRERRREDAFVETPRPSFSDDATPVDRADDFSTDDVGVKEAIARNKERYGDADDDYFTIRGRYGWYKPITRDDQREATSAKDADKQTKRTEERRAERPAEPRFEREDRTVTRETRERDNQGRMIELGSRDDLDEVLKPRTPPRFAPRIRRDTPSTQTEARTTTPRLRERDLDTFSDTAARREREMAMFGPPAPRDLPSTTDLSSDVDDLFSGDDFESQELPRTRGSSPETDIAMLPRTPAKKLAPQFDRIQPVKAGYEFAAGWTGDSTASGWVAVAKQGARLGDYLSLRAVTKNAALKLRAPSEPGRYELRFLSSDRRVVMARQSFEVETAPVRLVALGFVDPSDELNVWWSGPGNTSDSLTLSRVGADDTRYLSKQSVGKGNPLTIKAPSEPGTYEMRYVNGTDNRVMFRRKLIVAASPPKLLGP